MYFPQGYSALKRHRSFKIIQAYKEDFLLYQYFHKRHKNIVPRITETLTKFKQAGQLDIYNIELDRKPSVVQ